MSKQDHITPTGVDDAEGAERVFNEFFTQYQPVFKNVEIYLGKIIKEAPEYADAYRPWQNAIHHLSDGIALTIQNHQLPEDEEFAEALRMFSFDGAINFLEDISSNCRLNLERDWSQHFHDHLNALLLAFSILRKTPQRVSVTIK